VSITPQATVSVTPPITPSRSPLTITALYYNNQEFSDGTVFLDGNVAVNQNGSNIINEVFTTPGDVLYTGGTIFQDDSIFAQATGNIIDYPKPAYGTSTRRLYIVDSAGNTINDVTVDYNSNTTKTFTVVGGRTYYVRGYTNFTYPSSATLYINGLFNYLSEYYYDVYLDSVVEGTFSIDAYGISTDVYFTSDCTFGSEDTISSNAAATFTKGQSGTLYVPTGYSSVFGFVSQRVVNTIYINGNSYSNGSTFTLGNTTVTVVINRNCQLIN
jgi:hypothetical protein